MENKLKHYRNEFGYSQDKLAKILKVSRQTIISIEKGKYNPSLPLALVMANTFETSVEEIFSLDKEEIKHFFGN